MRIRSKISVLATTLCVAAIPAQAQVVKGVYINDELGFRIRVPEDWSEIPIRIDENWIVAKFLSKKSWLSKSKEFSEEHRPLMTVTVFTEDATRFKGWATARKGNTTFTQITDLPYQNYRDYLKRNLESGYFFDKEEDILVAGQKVSRYEILQHKKDPKKRLLTYVYHGEDMDVAVEFEVLEDRLDRLRSTCEQSLASFHFTDGGKLVSGPTTGSGEAGTDSSVWTKFRDEWKKTPIKERTKIRKDVEARRFEKLRKSTPDSWNVSESKNFLVISHVDDKTTRKLVDSCESFRKWCDENFGGLSDDYVRRGVLRICADSAEYEAYRYKVSGDSWSFLLDEDREVVTYKDPYSGSSGEGIADLFDDVMEMYLADVDPLLLQYTPSWLRSGLVNYVTSAWMKGKDIDFRVDDFEREDMKQLERDGKLRSLRTLMTLDEEEYVNTLSKERALRSQLTNVFRFIDGPGRSQPALKNFVNRYLAGVIEIADDLRKKWDAEPVTYRKEAQTEEEEEKQAKEKRSNQLYTKRTKELAEALNAKILSFDGKTWDRLEKAYEKFAKN